MGFYNLWCKNEKKYKLHSIINKDKNQIIHCMSCGLYKTNVRLSKHASISNFLLTQENLNHNWGDRKQQQLLKQEIIEQRKEKVNSFVEQKKKEAEKIAEKTKRGAIWLKKKIQGK